MNGGIPEPVRILLIILASTVGLAVGLFLLVWLFGFIWRFLGRLFRFIGHEITDAFRVLGALLVAVAMVPMVVFSVVLGRWSASAHFGRVLGGELAAMGRGLYRLVIGNPARLVGLESALEGVEQRLPQAIAEAPGRDRPRGRAGQFDGYTLIGSLPGGGSGGKLYVAEPDELKRAGLERRGFVGVDKVVIKVFSTADGSTLDQIVREGRALEAARELGLVLEHQSEPERFWYAMRYVPGDSLATVIQRLHAASPSEGLGASELRRAVGFVGDLLWTLERYHRGGLWHKDVKPDNIIIEARAGRAGAGGAGAGGAGGAGPELRASLVDFGLVTPIASAMTLTTHGTEYFRDPELVKQALRGVKVNEIDGRRFDVYSAGAVLYAAIENSFPAHGGLSRITKRCPEALKWVVRRAMTDYDKRYPTAAAMLADVRSVLEAADPFALRPADLPSVRSGDAQAAMGAEPAGEDAFAGVGPTPNVGPSAGPKAAAVAPGFREGVAAAAAGAAAAARAAAGAAAQHARRNPNWWTGGAIENVGENVGDAKGFVFRVNVGQGDGARGTPAPRGPVPVAPVSVGPVSVGPASVPPVSVAGGGRVAPLGARDGGTRAPAREQLKSARERARVRRERAMSRIGQRRAAAVARTRGPGAMNAGVAVALFVFLGACVGLGAALLRSQRSGGGGGGVEHIAVIDGVPAPAAAAYRYDVATGGPVLAGRRVLVLSDLALPLSDQHAALVGSVTASLREAGAVVVGEGAAADDAAAVRLAALFRAARGGLPLDDDQLPRVLGRVLSDVGAEAQAVVWVGPGTGSLGTGSLGIGSVGSERSAPVRYVLAAGPVTSRGTLDGSSVPAVLSNVAMGLSAVTHVSIAPAPPSVPGPAVAPGPSAHAAIVTHAAAAHELVGDPHAPAVLLALAMPADLTEEQHEALQRALEAVRDAGWRVVDDAQALTNAPKATLSIAWVGDGRVAAMFQSGGHLRRAIQKLHALPEWAEEAAEALIDAE